MPRVTLSDFERLARRAHLFSDADASSTPNSHPFEQRNIYDNFPVIVRELFDDSHYAQATFEALKFLDREVARLSAVSETGKKLMMGVFSETNPSLQLTPLSTDTDRSEQEGYKFLFAGSILAIRNPRGHEYSVIDAIDDCLDHLSFVSMLIRRLESAGFTIQRK